MGYIVDQTSDAGAVTHFASSVNDLGDGLYSPSDVFVLPHSMEVNNAGILESVEFDVSNELLNLLLFQNDGNIQIRFQVYRPVCVESSTMLLSCDFGGLPSCFPITNASCPERLETTSYRYLSYVPRYTLIGVVGMNVTATRSGTHHLVKLGSNEEIAVKSADVLGFQFGAVGDILPFQIKTAALGADSGTTIVQLSFEDKGNRWIEVGEQAPDSKFVYIDVAALSVRVYIRFPVVLVTSTEFEKRLKTGDHGVNQTVAFVAINGLYSVEQSDAVAIYDPVMNLSTACAESISNNAVAVASNELFHLVFTLEQGTSASFLYRLGNVSHGKLTFTERSKDYVYCYDSRQVFLNSSEFPLSVTVLFQLASVGTYELHGYAINPVSVSDEVRLKIIVQDKIVLPIVIASGMKFLSSGHDHVLFVAKGKEQFFEVTATAGTALWYTWHMDTYEVLTSSSQINHTFTVAEAVLMGVLIKNDVSSELITVMVVVQEPVFGIKIVPNGGFVCVNESVAILVLLNFGSDVFYRWTFEHSGTQDIYLFNPVEDGRQAGDLYNYTFRHEGSYALIVDAFNNVSSVSMLAHFTAFQKVSLVINIVSVVKLGTFIDFDVVIEGAPANLTVISGNQSETFVNAISGTFTTSIALYSVGNQTVVLEAINPVSSTTEVVFLQVEETAITTSMLSSLSSSLSPLLLPLASPPPSLSGSRLESLIFVSSTSPTVTSASITTSMLSSSLASSTPLLLLPPPPPPPLVLLSLRSLHETLIFVSSTSGLSPTVTSAAITTSMSSLSSSSLPSLPPSSGSQLKTLIFVSSTSGLSPTVTSASTNSMLSPQPVSLTPLLLLPPPPPPLVLLSLSSLHETLVFVSSTSGLSPSVSSTVITTSMLSSVSSSVPPLLLSLPLASPTSSSGSRLETVIFMSSTSGISPTVTLAAITISMSLPSSSSTPLLLVPPPPPPAPLLSLSSLHKTVIFVSTTSGLPPTVTSAAITTSMLSSLSSPSSLLSLVLPPSPLLSSSLSFERISTSTTTIQLSPTRSVDFGVSLLASLQTPGFVTKPTLSSSQKSLYPIATEPTPTRVDATTMTTGQLMTETPTFAEDMTTDTYDSGSSGQESSIELLLVLIGDKCYLFALDDKYAGCFANDTSNDIYLSGYVKPRRSTAVSVSTCQQACVLDGHSYAAYSNESRCFCGNNLPSTKVEDYFCNVVCGVDCGRYKFSSVYTTADVLAVALSVTEIVTQYETVTFRISSLVNGKINDTSFHWDFGDFRSVTVTTTDMVFHQYMMPGSYTVRLTAIDVIKLVAVDEAAVRVVAEPKLLLAFDKVINLQNFSAVGDAWLLQGTDVSVNWIVGDHSAQILQIGKL